MGCKSSKSTEVKDSNCGSHEERQKRQNRDDGTTEDITPDEAVAFLTSECNMSKDMAKSIVSKLEQDEIGNVSKATILAIAEEVAKVRGELEPKFKEEDKKKTGVVSRDEAIAILKRKCSNLEMSHIEAFVSRFDKGAKARGGRVYYEDIVVFYTNLKCRKDAIMEKIASLDDSSGYVKYSEVVKVPVEVACFKKDWAKYLIEDFDCKEGSDVNRDKLEKVINSICG